MLNQIRCSYCDANIYLNDGIANLCGNCLKDSTPRCPNCTRFVKETIVCNWCSDTTCEFCIYHEHDCLDPEDIYYNHCSECDQHYDECEC